MPRGFRQIVASAAGLICLIGFATGCKSKEKYPDIGQNIASPVDVALADDGQHFFVLNADFDRTYNIGSILTLDKDGNKVGVIQIPRMGRALAVAGNDVLATIDRQDDDKGYPHVLLFDATDPKALVMKHDFVIDCSPINAVIRKNYPYFAVTCAEGTLFVGTLEADRSQSTLKKVRAWGTTRRAIYLDTKDDLLLGFTTDLGFPQVFSDLDTIDADTYVNAQAQKDANGNGIPNEVPDGMEQNARALSDLGQRSIYQFFVYDLATEHDTSKNGCTVSSTEDCVFPYRDVNNDAVAQAELRWIYYRLYNFDGTLDRDNDTIFSAPNFTQYKYYRTNFFAAKPDPDDPSVFYLSQRGRPDQARFGNQVVRVTITGDMHTQKQDDGTYKNPKTADIMSFERVYGFKGSESSMYAYPGDFQVTHIGGDAQKLIVVNDFRDLPNWARGDIGSGAKSNGTAESASLTAQMVDDPSWYSQLQGSLDSNQVRTYYQIAINGDGRAASCSFYGNSVYILDVVPGIGFNQVKMVQ